MLLFIKTHKRTVFQKICLWIFFEYSNHYNFSNQSQAMSFYLPQQRFENKILSILRFFTKMHQVQNHEKSSLLESWLIVYTKIFFKNWKYKHFGICTRAAGNFTPNSQLIIGFFYWTKSCKFGKFCFKSGTTVHKTKKIAIVFAKYNSLFFFTHPACPCFVLFFFSTNFFFSCKCTNALFYFFVETIHQYLFFVCYLHDYIIFISVYLKFAIKKQQQIKKKKKRC